MFDIVIMVVYFWKLFPNFQISGGWRHSMAITSDGQLYGWGWNKVGESFLFFSYFVLYLTRDTCYIYNNWQLFEERFHNILFSFPNMEVVPCLVFPNILCHMYFISRCVWLCFSLNAVWTSWSWWQCWSLLSCTTGIPPWSGTFLRLQHPATLPIPKWRDKNIDVYKIFISLFYFSFFCCFISAESSSDLMRMETHHCCYW